MNGNAPMTRTSSNFILNRIIITMMGIMVAGITAIRQFIRRIFHAFKYKPSQEDILTNEVDG